MAVGVERALAVDRLRMATGKDTNQLIERLAAADRADELPDCMLEFVNSPLLTMQVPKRHARTPIFDWGSGASNS